MKFKNFNEAEINLTKYLFFTGKGGVGKTSTACATAVTLADAGKKIMLISTDPASNLQDVFNTELNNKGIAIKDVPNLIVANFNPEEAAAEYKESVIAPYRGKLPEVVLKNMEEQLSGSCTVEIAAFNEFSNFIIVTLAETTPVYEAMRLQKDLDRAGIHSKWWAINSSFYAANTTNDILKAKASNEVQWINKVNEISKGNFAITKWMPEEVKGEKLNDLIG